MPPVECLSTTGPGRFQSSTLPESRMASVQATRSVSSSRLRRTAIAKAPAWASVTAPEARPLANHVAASAGSPFRSRTPAMIWRASISAPPHVRRLEPPGQEIAHRRVEPLAIGGGKRHRRVVAAELRKLLAAAAAGRHRGGAVGDDGDLDELGLARGDHGRDRPGLGAGALGIGHVLDVAARVDAAGPAAHGGADLEMRIGNVVVLPDVLPSLEMLSLYAPPFDRKCARGRGEP